MRKHNEFQCRDSHPCVCIWCSLNVRLIHHEWVCLNSVCVSVNQQDVEWRSLWNADKDVTNHIKIALGHQNHGNLLPKLTTYASYIHHILQISRLLCSRPACTTLTVTSPPIFKNCGQPSAAGGSCDVDDRNQEAAGSRASSQRDVVFFQNVSPSVVRGRISNVLRKESKK